MLLAWLTHPERWVMLTHVESRIVVALRRSRGVNARDAAKLVKMTQRLRRCYAVPPPWPGTEPPPPQTLSELTAEQDREIAIALIRSPSLGRPKV